MQSSSKNQPAAGRGANLLALTLCALLVYLLSTAWLSLQDGYVALGCFVGAAILLPLANRRLRVGARVRAAAAAEPAAAAVIVLAAALLLPFAMASNNYANHVLTIAVMFAIMAVGLNVHLGGAGLINIGYGGLFAVGAYASALVSVAGGSFWLSVLVAVVACCLFGAALGACAARTSGDYFALVTLGFGLIIHQLIINLTWLTQGTNGISNIRPPAIFGHSTKAPIDLGFIVLSAEANFYYLALAFLVLGVVLYLAVERSWIGRTWSAMRADRISTSCFGVNVPMFQIQTVAFGSGFAGVAGAIYAHNIGFISPDDFTLSHSIELIAMVILGGIGNVWGVIAGAIVLVAIPEKLRVLGDYRLLAYGALLVALLVYRQKASARAAAGRA
jgi:branched-chain amino acid transport system permease protein